MPARERLVHVFGAGEAPTTIDKAILGGKGAGLSEMARLGLPVPPGFVVTTEVCRIFTADGSYPADLASQVEAAVAWLEQVTGRRFGDPADPLLLSVRSGAPISMPGMMDTVLNLGLSRASVEAGIAAGADARFLLDCYRRLLTMYGDVVLEVDDHSFEQALEDARSAQGVATDRELSIESLWRVVEADEAAIRAAGVQVPEDPREQLWDAIGAVFGSWGNRRAREYRRLHDIPESLGTAVNVQTMVFGNRGEDCATGVAFTRNPSTGEHRLYGEFLRNAQGEDVVAGIRTPEPVLASSGSSGLAATFPAAAAELERLAASLEHHFRDMLDLEFTIEAGRLYMLQTRTGKRTGAAAVRIAVEMVEEGLIDQATALARVAPEQLSQLLAPDFDPEAKRQALAAGRLLAKGLPAGPGAACGRVALESDRAAEMAKDGPVVLVRAETSPEDIVGMAAAVGIVTARGGMTSHAAVVARGLGKPCVAGAGGLIVDEAAGTVKAGSTTVREGDWLALDGTSGEVFAGELSPREALVLRTLLEGGEESPAVHCFRRLLEWADATRRLKVRTNADTPHDAAVARALGAEGIGLCRTEHMFFAEERIGWVRQMILAEDDAAQAAALAHLLPMQQGDFEGIFRAMDGLPVTIRLLDPPLHEFLPHDPELAAQLAMQMGITAERVMARVAQLSEANPMLGHRGCRLGLTSPAITEMQAEAIARAAVACHRAGVRVHAEIMVPLVGLETEIAESRRQIDDVVQRVFRAAGCALDVHIGTMIEVPRACVVADQIARHADFFSFGTNDLTQMTFGYSRDDAGTFLPDYVAAGILPGDPFASLDVDGVGALVAMAVDKGRRARSTLKIGICGEHGGDPPSIEFFDRVGLDYVSCSPYRVPIARLAAARSSLSRAGLHDEAVGG
jgi:pyruvate,orthophosphate dikinase